MSDANPTSDELSEEEVTAAIRRSLEALKEQGIDSRNYSPVLINRQTGQIIDGNTRLGIDGSWPTVEADLDPTQAEIVKFQLNFARRRMKREEITESLSRIAELTKWTPQEIAENLGLNPMFVYRNLPRKYKNKKRGRQPGQTPYYAGSVKRERTIRELEAKLADAEAREEKLVEVVFGEQEEKVKPKTAEQIAEEVFQEYPRAPLRFAMAAIRISYPDLSEEEIKEIAENLRPEQIPLIDIPMGFACPVCGTWKPSHSMKRCLTELGKNDPELVEVVLIRLRRQGWEG